MIDGDFCLAYSGIKHHNPNTIIKTMTNMLLCCYALSTCKNKIYGKSI
jgi:hypothetical protein